MERDPRILVDAEDEWLLEQFRWRVVRSGGSKTEYAVRGIRRNGKYELLRLHRVITDAPKGVEVDHINGDGLDDRRGNLRLATMSQNMANRSLNCNNNSGRKGVRWHRSTGRWQARIRVGGKELHLGLFDNLDDAARAYDQAAVESFGVFALTNRQMGLLSE